MSREDDIQILVKTILGRKIQIYEDDNNGDNYYCPFCYERLEWIEECNQQVSMDSIKHDKDCAYLVAKDLRE